MKRSEEDGGRAGEVDGGVGVEGEAAKSAGDLGSGRGKLHERQGAEYQYQYIIRKIDFHSQW